MRKPTSTIVRNSARFGEVCSALLEAGATVRFSANGLSMRPNILDNDAVIVASVPAEDLHRGDVAFTHGKDGFRVHRVAAAVCGEGVITRSDAGQENDSATDRVFGKVIAIERDGLRHSLAYPGQRYLHAARSFAFQFAQASALRAAKLVSASAFLSLAILFGLLLAASPVAGQSFAVTNTPNPATATIGTSITYTQVITSGNGGPISHPITTTQTVPTGMTFVSAAQTGGQDAWTCALAAGVITCTDNSTGTYPRNRNTTFSIVLTINSTAAYGTLAETVTVNGNNTTAASGTGNITVTGPDIQVTDTDAPDPVSDGGSITYTQAVKNNDATATSVNPTLTETIPANTTYQSITIPTGWTCGTLPAVGGTGTISCTAPTLAAGTTSTFSVVVQVNATVAAGNTISDTVTVAETGTDPTPANNTATTTTTVTIPDIQVTNTDAPDPVSDGGNITYTQAVKNNNATVTAVNPTLTETIPTNTTYQSITIPTGWACGTLPAVGGTGSISCTAPTLAAGTTSTFSVVVQVNATVAAGTNAISDTVTVGETGTDPTPANNTATTTTTVTIPDIQVTNTDAPDPVSDGGNITYTQAVKNNNATVTAVNPTLTETIPANTTYQSITIPTGWACGTLPAVGGTGSISCTAPTLAAGTTSTFSVVVQVNATVATGSTITDTVTVGETGTDPTTSNNTATATTTVTIPDISVTNADAPDPTAPGGPITYTQVVKDVSTTVAAVNLTLTETIPTNTTYQSITIPTGWTCGTLPAVGATGTISCTAPTLAANTTATFNVAVQVNGSVTAGSTISDTVTVGETGTDPVPANNTATTTTGVQDADISVTETASPNPVGTGGNITYAETVTNNSAVASAGTTLTQNTPPSTLFQSVTPPTGWTCGTQPAVGATGSIVCTVTGTVAANSSVAFSVVVSVSPEAAVGSSITNSVTVSETGTDPVPGNNTTSATVVVQGADLSMTQTASATAIAPTGQITYTETVTNNGPNAATNAVVYQQTPVNTTFVSMTPPTGWTCTKPGVGGTGQVICTDGSSLAANTTTTNFLFVVAVTSTTAAGTVITNQADVTSDITDSKPANNGTFTSVLVELTPDADLSVAVTALPTPVFISSSITYTIQVSNSGLAPATGVVLTDTLPFTGTSPNQVSALSNVTASSTQGTCVVNTSTYPFTVTCTLGGVAYPLSTPITITISGTSPATPMTLSNTAVVSSSSTDPVPGNNTVTTLTVVQPLVCALPGNDGSPANPITGIVNAYYPPAAVGTVAAGSTSITLGPAATNGAQANINVGDLVLIIQMQAAQINSTNTTSYGDNIPGDPFGSTNLANTGVFEFVTATNSVVTAAAGGTLTFTGTGANNGLLNVYTSAAATSSQGAQTFQVIRVPQYSSVTLGSSATTVYPAMAWNGSTGGVFVLDVASQLTLGGGSVVLDGYGFRGGAGIIERGIAGFLKTDTVDPSPTALPNLTAGDPAAGGGAGGGKGEGIAGTPQWVAPSITAITHASTASNTTQTYVEGYPNGSFARGAPGNAGGGATDADPAANDQNSGGGGAGNGGQGGLGGFGWNTAGLVGGYGGAPFPTTTSALVMGGGGGGGTTNNGSYWDPSSDTGNADCGLNCTGVYSSGGAGGGIVIIHAGTVIGSGTISSNGQTALAPENDGGGGGGAGGTIFVFSNSGNLTGLTAIANGGNGGNTWPEETPGDPFPANRHGAGGGGGGGVIFTTSPTNSNSTAANGNPGWSTLANDPYGATPGLKGVINSSLTVTQTPGTQSGAFCGGADLSVTNAGSPNPVLAGPGPGNVITYAQSVTNGGPLNALNAVFSEAIPANTTFQGLTFPGGSGWTCNMPAIGGVGSISCSNPNFANGATTNFSLAVAVNTGVTSGTVITDIDNATAGNPDPNLANNSATVQTTVGLGTTADLSVTDVASPNPVIAGNNIQYTIVVTNNGPAAANAGGFSMAIPANTTFVSATPTPSTGWTCNANAGYLICSNPTVAANSSTSFAVIVTVNAATPTGTVITDTVNVAASTIDPNPNNNSATATDVVATSGQSDLSITSTATPNPVTDNNNITYVQTVTNNGPAASGLVTYTDTIPTGSTFVSLNFPSTWTCSLPAVGGTGTISCTIPSLALNASSNFKLVVQASLGDVPGSTIVDTAAVNVPCSSASDPNCANNSVTNTVFVASPSQADLAIVKTASPDPVDQGTNLTYTLQVTNNGPATAQNVVVSDTIPGEVTFFSASSTQGSCSNTVGPPVVVTCSLNSVSVGAMVVVTINATANTFSSSTLSTNTATVSSTTGDPNLANNSSTFVSTIAAPTAVQLASFRAYPRQGGGVLLEWKTRAEVRNLGFNIYRVDGPSRQRLNPSILAGSALRIRGALPQHAAKTYQWFDPNGTSQAVYELEDVDLNGTRSTHGPVSEDVSAAPRSGAISKPLYLTQLNSAIVQPIGNGQRILKTPFPIISNPPRGTVPVSLDGEAAVKISVENEGWYQVSKSQLVAAGLNPNADARMLELYAEGIEQPFLILGSQSGPLGPNDSIEFYGTGIDTPYSDARVYWLFSGTHPGLRINTAASTNSANSGLQSFPFTVVLQQRTTYFGTLLNGDNNDNFFGAAVTSEPVDQQLTVAHADPNSPMQVSVDITLQGATDQQPHSVSVQFNGASIGEMDFANLSNPTQTFPIDRSLLLDGTNTVTLTALQGDNDISVVQSIALHYPHTYDADGNWLKATAPAGSSVHVGGFTNQQVQVFDITNPLAISQVNGTVAQENSAYGVTFGAPQGAETRTLLIFSGDQISAPSALAFHTPAALAAQSFGSQMIVITHPDFQSAIAPLVSLHESRGMSVQVVTIDEVFDAFNYGERSPYAIRDFLQSAESNWIRKPQFLFLVGAASLDPRDYLGLGDFDFVPTRIIETAAFKTASDDWFSDFNQTGFATIATGRIPVRTPADATLVVSKLVNFEKGLAANASNPQALLVADQNIGADFTTATKFAAGDLPTAFQPLEIFADNQDPSIVSQQILAALNAGPLLVNYSGHGAEEQWSFSDLLDDTSVATLSNSNQLSVYFLMDCLNGFFQDVYATSLAESLLLAPNGGAAAVWASSGFTNQPPQATMNQALLQILKANPSMPLATAIMQAKTGISDSDVRRTWIFFGDPAMTLQLSPSTSTGPRSPIGVRPPIVLRP